MTGSNQTIVTLYEIEGLTPEQIAQTQEFDVAAVKAVLMSFSSKYRSDMKTDRNLDFNDDELELSNKVITRIMQYSEDEHLQLRAAKYVRDDKKGRLDVAKSKSPLGTNIVILNQFFAEAQKRLQESKSIIIEHSDSEKKLLTLAQAKHV